MRIFHSYVNVYQRVCSVLQLFKAFENTDTVTEDSTNPTFWGETPHKLVPIRLDESL